MYTLDRDPRSRVRRRATRLSHGAGAAGNRGGWRGVACRRIEGSLVAAAVKICTLTVDIGARWVGLADAAARDRCWQIGHRIAAVAEARRAAVERLPERAGASTELRVPGAAHLSGGAAQTSDRGAAVLPRLVTAVEFDRAATISHLNVSSDARHPLPGVTRTNIPHHTGLPPPGPPSGSAQVGNAGPWQQVSTAAGLASTCRVASISRRSHKRERRVVAGEGGSCICTVGSIRCWKCSKTHRRRAPEAPGLSTAVVRRPVPVGVAAGGAMHLRDGGDVTVNAL